MTKAPPKPVAKLKFTKVKITPRKVKRGKSATLKATVKNVGTALAEGMKVCVKMTGTASGVVKPDPNCRTISKLAKGKSRTVSFKLKTTRKAPANAKALVTVRAKGVKEVRTTAVFRTKR